ncbi:hypothetical protein Cgig2_021480 [Carnegiea gigantea]|uniref:Uncharacterized protein n=1 Tax=Carnegiea gigantea TaxID=171969 RepID=A0A9Q1GIB9_9CARY|nr:hypothetical protein Cgig2_021480 [Carnegiea gigantea]
MNNNGGTVAIYSIGLNFMFRSYENICHLKSLREVVEVAKVSVKKVVLRSISDVKAMKGNNTMNGQCIWICGCIENLDKIMIRLYLGCDTCGSKTYEDIGTKYKYSTPSCTSRTSTPISSKVLGIEADKLYRIEYEDCEKFYAQAAEVFAKKPINIKFTPEATFATSRILKWVMKESFGYVDGFYFVGEHDWWSLMHFGYFVNIHSDG